VTTSNFAGNKLDFLWLELTNRCNLQCIHCYTESHPHSGDRDLLRTKDYESIMFQAYALGCRKIQFIGGEPQLYRDFLMLLVKAKEVGFEFIEVFSNLTQLNDDTIQFSSNNKVWFATSVYSNEPSEHDAITKVKSSYAHTIRNLRRLIDKGVETRAGIIAINQSKGSIERTRKFLVDLGVKHVGVSGTRAFGRGEKVLSQGAQLSSLCGNCWKGKLCIAPDGIAYPCVMARKWPVGSVLESPLQEIVQGQLLEEMRGTIFEDVWLPSLSASAGHSVG
jgi:MoaA/NifB/PqqE/SkfB family radical SAM enzyme